MAYPRTTIFTERDYAEMDRKKKEYVSPEFNVVVLKSKDVVTDSVPLPDDTLEP